VVDSDYLALKTAYSRPNRAFFRETAMSDEVAEIRSYLEIADCWNDSFERWWSWSSCAALKLRRLLGLGRIPSCRAQSSRSAKTRLEHGPEAR
jgi:hypothetical protein